MKRGLSVMVILLVTGCVPLHNEYSPSISGIVLSGNEPESNVSICLKTAELPRPECVRSDVAGRFRLATIKHFEMASVADHYTFYEVKLETKTGSVLGYVDDFSVGMDKSIELTCDLKKPVRRGCVMVYCESPPASHGIASRSVDSSRGCDK